MASFKRYALAATLLLLGSGTPASGEFHRFLRKTKERIDAPKRPVTRRTEELDPINPSNFISGYLQKKTRVKIWLYEDSQLSIEGRIIGFDEYMNFVLESATAVDHATGRKRDVGRILLKGDAITLLQDA